MTQTKEPKTETLRKLRDILRAMIATCADALSQEERYLERMPELRHFYGGKMDTFASVLGLLEQLGPQIEEEAIEMGIEHAQETVGDWYKPL